MRSKWIVVGATLICTLLCTAARAQQFWEKKDYQHWSRQECQKLLEDSPWATRLNFPVGTMYFQMASTPPVPGRVGGTDPLKVGAGTVTIFYTFQLRSVLPVRQAVVRCAQIEQNYQGMSSAEKQAFDTRVRDFLSLTSSDLILVHGIYGTDQGKGDNGLAKFWQLQTTATLKDSVALVTTSGGRIAPLRFTVLPDPGREFEFEFPRTVEGKPILSAADKVLRLELTVPSFNVPLNAEGKADLLSSQYGMNTVTKKVAVEFKLERMTYKGQLLF